MPSVPASLMRRHSPVCDKLTKATPALCTHPDRIQYHSRWPDGKVRLCSYAHHLSGSHSRCGLWCGLNRGTEMTRIPERTDIGFSLYAKRTVSRGWLAALLLLMIISRGDAASAGGWAATRFEAGLRLGTFSLDEDSEITRDAEGNVCGGYTCGISIDTLDVDQSYIPLPFVRVFFNDYIGLQVSWESAKVAALADAQWEELETHKDGDVMIAGRIATQLEPLRRWHC